MAARFAAHPALSRPDVKLLPLKCQSGSVHPPV